MSTDDGISDCISGTVEFIGPEIREMYIGNHDLKYLRLQSREDLNKFFRTSDMFSICIIIYCLGICCPNPPKKLNYCKVTKKKILKKK